MCELNERTSKMGCHLNRLNLKTSLGTACLSAYLQGHLYPFMQSSSRFIKWTNAPISVRVCAIYLHTYASLTLVWVILQTKCYIVIGVSMSLYSHSLHIIYKYAVGISSHSHVFELTTVNGVSTAYVRCFVYTRICNERAFRNNITFGLIQNGSVIGITALVSHTPIIIVNVLPCHCHSIYVFNYQNEYTHHFFGI